MLSVWFLLGHPLSNLLCQGLIDFVWVEMFASTYCNPVSILRTSWKNKCKALVLDSPDRGSYYMLPPFDFLHCFAILLNLLLKKNVVKIWVGLYLIVVFLL